MAKSKMKEKIVSFPKKDDLCDYWNEQVDDAISDRSTWNDARQKWYRMRMRIRKPKTFPFKNCANVKLPTAEVIIRRLKAGLSQNLFGIRPVVQAIPAPSTNPETGLRAEKFIDHLIMDVDKAKLKSIMALDQELEQGFVVLKPFWDYEETVRIEESKVEDIPPQLAEILFSDAPEDELIPMFIDYYEVDTGESVIEDNIKEIQACIVAFRELGKTEHKLQLKDILKNNPSFDYYDANRVILPSDARCGPQNARWIAFETDIPYEKALSNAETKGWDIKALEDIDWVTTQDEEGKKSYLGTNVRKISDIDFKDLNEGIQTYKNQSHLIRLREIYCWYDINGDGVVEKCVITVAPQFKKILRKTTLPFDNGKFPAIKLAYEYREDRWLAHRGICEMSEDIIKEIDTQHNMKLDAMTIRNAPMYTYRVGAVNPRLIKFIPAQAIPRQDKDDLTALNNSNPQADFSWDREQQMLEAKTGELFGQVDYSLQSMINRRQPRTAEEVGEQANSSRQVFSLDAETTLESFSELWQWYADLWFQYGDDQRVVQYFGEDGFETIQLKREEIQGMKFIVRGNDRNTNPQVKMQTAQLILQDVYSAVQTGTATPQNIFNARRRFYQALGEVRPDLYVSQPPPPAPPQPSPEIIKSIFDKLTPMEQAQIKQLIGIQPDMKGATAENELVQRLKASEIDKNKSDIERDKMSTLTNTLKTINEGRQE